MYDKDNFNRIDSEHEYQWFMDTVTTKHKSMQEMMDLSNVLSGLFYGTMRLVLGYSWLKEVPKNIDLTGKEIKMTMVQDENGHMQNDILGRWEIIISIQEGQTTQENLYTILRTMERFIRARFDVKEPRSSLEAIAIEYKRKALLNEHFIGYGEEHGKEK